MEYASLRTAIMNRLHKVNIAIPDLQMFNEYGSIIPNNISLLYKKFKGYKPNVYNIKRKKVDACSCTSIIE